MRLMVVVALASALTSGQAMAAEQFDLICKGESRTPGQSWSPDERRYRLDLVAKRWCYESCAVVKPIQEVTPDLIVIQRSSETGRGRIEHTINRANGTFIDTTEASYLTIYFRGTCEPAPFSGLPAPKF